MSRELNLKDLIEWQATAKVRYALSSTVNGTTELFATVRGGYEVWKNGVCVLECVQPFQAVEEYNKLTV